MRRFGTYFLTSLSMVAFHANLNSGTCAAEANSKEVIRNCNEKIAALLGGSQGIKDSSTNVERDNLIYMIIHLALTSEENSTLEIICNYTQQVLSRPSNKGLIEHYKIVIVLYFATKALQESKGVPSEVVRKINAFGWKNTKIDGKLEESLRHLNDDGISNILKPFRFEEVYNFVKNNLIQELDPLRVIDYANQKPAAPNNAPSSIGASPSIGNPPVGSPPAIGAPPAGMPPPVSGPPQGGPPIGLGGALLNPVEVTLKHVNTSGSPSTNTEKSKLKSTPPAGAVLSLADAAKARLEEFKKKKEKATPSSDAQTFGASASTAQVLNAPPAKKDEWDEEQASPARQKLTEEQKKVIFAKQKENEINARQEEEEREKRRLQNEQKESIPKKSREFWKSLEELIKLRKDMGEGKVFINRKAGNLREIYSVFIKYINENKEKAIIDLQHTPAQDKQGDREAATLEYLRNIDGLKDILTGEKLKKENWPEIINELEKLKKQLES